MRQPDEEVRPRRRLERGQKSRGRPAWGFFRVGAKYSPPDRRTEGCPSTPCSAYGLHHEGQGNADALAVAPVAEGAMIVLKKVLVATDFSESSNGALAYGRELAFTFGARLVIVHVTENVLARGPGGGDGVVFADPELQRSLEGGARCQLESLISDEDREQLDAVGVVLTSNSPAQAITEFAKEAAADLVVLGTHGRGAMARLLMGSVANRVVRTAPCPVLTVRTPARDVVRPDAQVAVAGA